MTHVLACLPPAGVTLSLFVFLARLPGMIASYGPTLVSRGPAWCSRRPPVHASQLCMPAGANIGAPCCRPDPTLPRPRSLLLAGPQLSGAAFFALCAVAAASVVASYVGLLVGAGGTAAYASLSLAAAAHQQRLEGGGGRRRIAYQHED